MNLQKYGPWALIAGGSEGIGAGYARKLAAKGFKIVIVARSPGPMEELAKELRAGGAEVRTLSADLGKADVLKEVRKVTDDIEIGMFIHNAGTNKVRGTFLELDLDISQTLLNVNLTSQFEFTHHYGNLMRKRGRGGIILSGSSASFLGAPTLATYCGAKAFSRLFTEALWAECKPMGIDVLHLVVHFTATPAMRRLGWSDLSKAQDPEEVAQEALDYLGKGPLWLAGGESGRETAQRRSVLANRGDLILTIATPPKRD